MISITGGLNVLSVHPDIATIGINFGKKCLKPTKPAQLESCLHVTVKAHISVHVHAHTYLQEGANGNEQTATEGPLLA